MEETDKQEANDQLDLDMLMDVLDNALSSDNPIVQDQLRKLLMVAALTKTAHPDAKVAGIFTQMRQALQEMMVRITALEKTVEVLQSKSRTYGGITSSPTEDDYKIYKDDYLTKKIYQDDWSNSDVERLLRDLRLK